MTPLEEAAQRLCDAVALLQCQCSVKERDSGHLATCNMTNVDEIADEVRALLPSIREPDHVRTENGWEKV